RVLNRFQATYGLATTDIITRETLSTLDTLMAMQEARETPIAVQLPIYGDLGPAPSNWPSKDHVAFLWQQNIHALPIGLQIHDRATMLDFFRIWYPRYDYTQLGVPLIETQYYEYRGGASTPKATLLYVASDLERAAQMLHEYGHSIESAPF